jgi:hypothetical protein
VKRRKKMKKYKVIRTYSMKTFQEFVEVEAETPEAASEVAAKELDARDDDFEASPGYVEIIDMQEEVEEME